MPARRPAIIGHHLIWTLYGHWLPNDLRGSGSLEVCSDSLAPLGPAHFGRKPAREQPTRGELKEFYKKANPLLDHSVFWVDGAKRQAIGDAISRIVAERNYTVWACAILSNHVHMVVRRHRDDALAMWRAIADATALTLRGFPNVGLDHPVWAARPYKVFLRTPAEVRGRIDYVEWQPGEGRPARSILPLCAYLRQLAIAQAALSEKTSPRGLVEQAYFVPYFTIFHASGVN